MLCYNHFSLRIVYVYTHFNTFFCPQQVILPLILFTQVTITSNKDPDEQHNSQAALAMNLEMYTDNADRRVLYHVDGPDVTPQDVTTVQERFPNVKFEDTKDIATGMLLLN